MATVTTRNGRVLIESLELDSATATVDDICAAIVKAAPKYTIPRQRLTLQRPEGVVVLKRGELISKYNIQKGEKVYFKDLGPQVDWTTVFLIEYLGPILIHSMFYRFPTLFYRVPEGLEAMPPRTVTQVVTMLFFMVHFLKRELETVHVHRFSNDTMPLRNLPKNCFHYWILGGLFTAYPIYAPGFEHGYFPGLNGPVALTLLSLIWIFAEVSNYKTHVILRDLRPPGTRVRNIPKGYGFDLVTCPNYFFEILGWVAISLITGSIAMWIFTVAGAVQMYLWAVKKHKRYIKEFGDKYPRKRKILIPFVL